MVYGFLMGCALITGGSGNIGCATAIALYQEHGLHILINYSKDQSKAEKAQEAVISAGGSAELVRFDVSSQKEVETALTAWEKNNPDKFISVLVNNAGIAKDSLFLWMKKEDWSRVVEISLNGMFYVTQHVIRKMLQEKYGRIINVSSLSGVRGMPGQVNYAAAKAGMIGATKSLAQEVARRNITVNAVAPGFVDSEMLDGMDMDQYIPMIPMNRVGKPEEIAAMISFLASPKASYITGEVININGGLYT